MSVEGGNDASGTGDGEQFRAFIDGAQVKNIYSKSDPPSGAIRSWSFAQLMNFDSENTDFDIQVGSQGTAQLSTSIDQTSLYLMQAYLIKFFRLLLLQLFRHLLKFLSYDTIVSQAYTPNQSEDVIIIGSTMMTEQQNLEVELSDFTMDQMHLNL